MPYTSFPPITASAVGHAPSRSRALVLAAMTLAVAMTFIDQTIVSVAAPTVQRDLGLSSTGMQWAVNAYILTLAALFAFGGRLADTVGHTKILVVGVIVFAGASAICGLTPSGSLAEGWIVAARAVQGAGAAIMFPAALAIVVQAFPLNHRGRALALFFGIAGALNGHRPDRRWLPNPMDLARYFLGKRARGPRRPGAHRHRPAHLDLPPGAYGLSGPGAHRRRYRAERVRVPAGVDVGLGRPGHLAVHRGRRGAAGCVLPR